MLEHGASVAGYHKRWWQKKKKKPAILIKFYDFTKGGTDIINQRVGKYTTVYKCFLALEHGCIFLHSSHGCIFLHSRHYKVNAQTMHSMNNNKNPRLTDSIVFGWQRAIGLLSNHIVSRKASNPTLQRSVFIKWIAY